MRAKVGLAVAVVLAIVLAALHASGGGRRGVAEGGRPAGTILIRVIAPALF
ncbi:hypothetical protein WBP06_15300 [Novosphingobium sp. BL-8H]|uniref:hypothetical protein n=1 Tax=Novosphingobium sp. BL-8H TaxID=3127640 RepID=UPI003757E289